MITTRSGSERSDGAAAVIAVPFPPLAESADPLPELLAHVNRDCRIGALLVRRGGHAVGVFDGRALIASKVGGSYVQGRTKAGGWSQQRYARRRANQAAQAYAEAAEAAVRILAPVAADLHAVVGGGDRPGVEAVLADPRLTEVRARFTGTVLPTPDPRLRVLASVRGPGPRGDDHPQRARLSFEGVVPCHVRMIGLSALTVSSVSASPASLSGR